MKNRYGASALVVAVLLLSSSAAQGQSAADGATKYANRCADCHGAAPDFATLPKVHKASQNAAAIPHYLLGDVDIAAFVPPGRPLIIVPSPPGPSDLTANSAKLLIASPYTTVITSYTASCTRRSRYTLFRRTQFRSVRPGVEG